jgi:hypothetical protein
MKTDLLHALKKELENTFGRRVLSSRDCLQMVDDIFQKTGYSINSNTLRRFFGLVKTDYQPSPSTLTILCKYCGFSSIDQVENISAELESSESLNREEILHYLVSLYKALPITADATTALTLTEQTIFFLERNPGLIDRFQREIAKTVAGQYYYFELLVNMDKLNDYYGNGLRYYVLAKNNEEAAVFSNSLQVLRHWLSENNSLLEKHMMEIGPASGNFTYPLHISARLFAARVFYAHLKNDSIDAILTDIIRYTNKIDFKALSPVQNIAFELPIYEALILTQHFDEATNYIKRAKTFFPSFALVSNQLNLLEKLADKKNTTKKIDPTLPAKKWQINSNQINKKYKSALFNLSSQKMNREELLGLINETGFSKLLIFQQKQV